MEKDIKKLIELLRTKPFVLESLDNDNQITFSEGSKFTISGLNQKRLNFVYQQPIWLDQTTTKLVFYGHSDKFILIQITDEYEDAKTIIKVTFENSGKTEENYFTLKFLM